MNRRIGWAAEAPQHPPFANPISLTTNNVQVKNDHHPKLDQACSTIFSRFWSIIPLKLVNPAMQTIVNVGYFRSNIFNQAW